MKSEELKELGLTEEQIKSVLEINQKDVSRLEEDLKKANDDLKVAEDKVKTTEEALKKFDGVDAEGMKKQIEDLKAELKTTEENHAFEIADRDFNDLVKEGIAEAKGKNVKVIKALLDMDTLKASKNQKEDVAKALKDLTEAEDSKMLFGEPETTPVGTVNLIGRVQKQNGDAEDAAMRAAMGLPPVQEQK